MILRQSLYLLTMFLFLSPGKAMENIEGSQEGSWAQPTKTSNESLKDWEVIKTLEPVTVRIWKNPDASETNEHISLQTQKHYMSLRPISEKLEDGEYTDFVNPCFAPLTYDVDQYIQNEKLKKGDELWSFETFTLHLDATSMDQMWENLLEGTIDSVVSVDKTVIGKKFKNMHYVNKKMRDGFENDIKLKRGGYSYRNDKNLYFTNTSIAFGLLGEGGLFGKDIYYLENPKYFVNELVFPPLPFFQTSFIEAIKTNFYTRAYNPSVQYITLVIQDFIKRQKLRRIHTYLEHFEIPSLPSTRKDEIIKMVDGNKSQSEIDKHLSDLNMIYHNQQSYLSATGWINTIVYSREW